MEPFVPSPVSLLDHFSGLEDPRQRWRVIYPLPEIVLLVLCVTLNARFDRAAPLSRPLVVAGQFDRSAIMRMACAVAKARPGFCSDRGEPTPLRRA